MDANTTEFWTPDLDTASGTLKLKLSPEITNRTE